METMNTEVVMEGLRGERHDKTGRGTESKNKRQKELETVDREHSERTVRKRRGR